MSAAEIIAAQPGMPGANVLIIADHASAHVPDTVALGIDPTLLATHIAIDIGVAAVARALCAAIGCGVVLAGVSRLVIDCNREEDAPGLVPVSSDGIAIPGNVGADIAARIAAYYRPYHDAVSAAINAMGAPLLLSLHSFTPQLASRPEERRPWDIGVLYNRDDRAARIAIPLLAAAGLHVGDQQPYSGTLLNATMNRHGEARGLAYLGIEMRQDHVADAAGQVRFATLLAPVVVEVARQLSLRQP